MRRFTLALAVLLAAAAANAQIYQWKDENGKTVISDKPPAGNARQPKKIDAPAASAGSSSSVSSSSSASPQKNLADQELEFRKRQKEAQDKSVKTEKEQAAAAERKENCDGARRQLQALESGERIALRDDKGERYFLEDEQREQSIARARAAVQSNCQ